MPRAAPVTSATLRICSLPSALVMSCPDGYRWLVVCAACLGDGAGRDKPGFSAEIFAMGLSERPVPVRLPATTCRRNHVAHAPLSSAVVLLLEDAGRAVRERHAVYAAYG